MAPVAFLDPVSPCNVPVPHHRRVDQGEDTLRPLRAPFTTDVVGDR
ncbi:hypothetical protein ACWDKQ_33215 [Saccharopolyspora sp. NPDC000995]